MQGGLTDLLEQRHGTLFLYKITEKIDQIDKGIFLRGSNKTIVEVCKTYAWLA
jgi:hypothetical protein